MTRKSRRGTGGKPVQGVLVSWPPHRCVGDHLKVPRNCLPRRTGSWVFTRRLCLFLVGSYLRAELLPTPQRKPSGCETERPAVGHGQQPRNCPLHLEVDPDVDHGSSSVGLRGNFWLHISVGVSVVIGVVLKSHLQIFDTPPIETWGPVHSFPRI